MQKKAQAAMEFLMTYGWAILVVLAAIAALAYFGVLSPDRFLPEKCVIDPGMACLDFKITPDTTILVLSNSLGNDIRINQIQVGSCNTTFNQDLSNGQQSTFTLTGCSNGEAGSSFKGDITIEYYSSSSNFTKSKVGTISSKIQ